MPIPPYPHGPWVIPEAVAQAVRDGDLTPWNDWIATTEVPPNWGTIDGVNPNDFVNFGSPTTGASPYGSTYAPTGENFPVATVFYPGTNATINNSQTSIPGVQIPPAVITSVAVPGAVGDTGFGGGGGGGGAPGVAPALPGVPDINPIIIGNLNDILGQVAPIIGSASGLISGQFEGSLDGASTITGKIPAKISDQLVDTMGQVYGTGIGVGLGVPTIDDIISGNVGFQFGPVGDTGFGGSGGAPAPEADVRFGVVGNGGFGGIGGGVVLPGVAPGPAIQGGGGGGGVLPGAAPVIQPILDPFDRRLINPNFLPNIVDGPIGPQQAGRPIPGGAFAPAAPGVPIFNPPPIGGGGGGVVGLPIGGGGGGGGGPDYSGPMGDGGYPPGSYPPGSYPPGSYPTAGDTNYQGGDYNYQGGDYSYDGGNYAPVSNVTTVDNSKSTTTTTYEGNTSTSTTTTTTTSTAPADSCPAPTPAPTPAPNPDDPAAADAAAAAAVPKPAPLRLPGGVLRPNSTQWEFGAACAIGANPGAFDSRLLWSLFGWSNVSATEYKPPGWLDPTNYPFGSQWVGSALMNTFGLGIQTLNKVSLASMPITNNFQDFMVLAMGGVVEKWIGAPILPFLQGTIYNINYNNPQLLPGIPDLQNLFRKGAISEEIFRCLVRANGSYDTWQMKIAESSTLVPSLYDIIKLYRGKKIGGNEFEYYANLNGLKISTPQGKTDIATFLEATRAIPGVADLVRMMVRDAADDKIAAKYGTDTDLNNKFAGPIESWSEQQGVDPEIMKYFWRAHWEIPSNTQLFDMLHKLRPNRRVGAVPGNIVTTADDVKQAIQVNDLTPYWVDRVMATSYSSLTRIDAQRAFFIEAINEDQLYDAYMDIGYNAANAQVLVDFTKELKRKRDSNLPGADKPANIISQLKKYVISETNAYDRLRATGMKPEKAKAAVSNSVRDRKEEARARCLKEAQRRFFRAEYDLLKYKSVVMQLGIPQENIEALVNETACLYDSRGKELNAGALCKAFKQNIIAFDQFQNRLQLIGYDKDESYIIAESCQIDKVVAIGKAKLAQEVKEKAEAEKAKKAEEKAKKDAEKAKEKAEKARLAEEKKKAKDSPAPP